MQKEQKASIVEELTETLSNAGVFYIADTADLDAESISNFRRICFKADIQLRVVKNTLLKKAFEQVEDRDYSEFYDILKGPTALMISEVGNAPAKVIKSFRKKHKKPILKGAWIEEAVFIGDDQVETLANIKSKEELIGEIIGLLQSPAKNVISALQSGGSTIAGLVKTLQERES
jgi:large subunit ribosomal protein L10